MKTLLRRPFYDFPPVLFIVPFLFLACAVSIGQTPRYVSPTGLDTNAGTAASPYKTILKAITAATTINGDTIKVAPGTYTAAATTTVSKSLLIMGTGATSSDVVLDRGSYASSAITGFTVTASNVTIKNLKVTNYNVGIGSTSAISNLILDNVRLFENWGAGFYSNLLNIDSLTITNSVISYNGKSPSASTLKRGIYLLDGPAYSTIKFENNTVEYNGSAGIEISLSQAASTTSMDGLTITNNIVRYNADAQVSTWLSAVNSLKKAVLINGNAIVLSDTARYGIEVRNPSGNGKTSGDGSVVLSNNTISVVSHTGNTRDMAAIAVIRRKEGAANAVINDQPQGVVVTGNTISDFQNPKAGDAYGIVFGGTGHSAYSNIITNTEFSIQLQNGNTNFGANTSSLNVAGQANTAYFDRDNSKDACVEVGSNTISGSGAPRLTTSVSATSLVLPSKRTTNATTGITFCTLQQAIDFKATLTGNTITANAGTYDEQLIISKGVVIDGVDSASRLATFTGTATGVKAIFTITAQNVTIKNFKFIVDLSKIYSAINTSGNASNLLITGNMILSDASVPATLLSPYASRNGININIAGTAFSPVTNVIIQSNTVSALSNSKFRAGVAADATSGMLVGGNSPGNGNNFLASVNHDLIIRSYYGDQAVKNNIFKGGGVEVSASAGNGAVIVSNNTFDGTYAHTIPSAMVRLFTNTFLTRTINFSYNQFVKQKWAISFENTRNVVLDHNDITAAYDSFRLISTNTKLRQTGSPSALETIDIKLTNNNLNSIAGLTTGNALEFLNFDQRTNNYLSGNYIIGEPGNENNFNENIPTFVKVSNLNGVNTSTQPFLDLYPEYNGVQYTSTTGYWARDIFARHNRYFVNGILKLASTFSEIDFNTVYSSIFDKQDDINVGSVVLMPTWSGGTSDDWSDNTNWSYQFAPSPGLDAIIYPQTNQPELKADAACDTLILLGGMTVKTGAYNLTVVGNVRGNGSIEGTTGSMILGGSTRQNLSGSIAIKNLTINNPAGAQITAGPGNKVTLRGKYTPTLGVLTTNDNLLLKSSATGTASIGSGSGEYILGKVIVERYIPAHRAWRLITSPVDVTGSQTIHDAWQEGVNNTTLNYSGNQDPAPGYGTHITLGNAAAAGFDVGINNNPSIKGFNATTGKWDILSGTNIPITHYPGYMLFVRGDRSVNLSQGTGAPATNTVLRSTGNIRMGDQRYNVAAAGFTVMGNPFASPIDFTKIAKLNSTNIQDNFYVWDPKITGTNGVGGAVNISWNGISYDITPSSGGSSISQYLQSGSAFLARSLDGTNPGTLVVKEADKVSAGNDNVYRPADANGISKLTTNLYSLNTDGTTSIVDGVLNSYGSMYSNAVDNMDAVKLGNLAENLSTLRDGQQLTVERRQPVITADTVYYRMTQMKLKKYNLEFKAERFDNLALSGSLEDNYLHSSTPLQFDETTTVNFTITADAGTSAPDRFRMVFKPLSVLPVTFSSIKAWGQMNDIKVEWKVENESGIKQYEIERSENGLDFTKSAMVPAAGDNQGVYNWLDKNVSVENNYYRIKIVGAGGDIHYSAVVKVAMRKGKEQIVLGSKLITDGSLSFQLVNMPVGRYGVKLLNSLAQVIFTRALNHTAGNSTETIELNKRPAKGMYLLKFTCPGNKKITEKIFAE